MSKKDCQNWSQTKLVQEYTEFLKRKKPGLDLDDKDVMNKRIKIVKDILKDNGIIVVAKDYQSWSHEKLLREYKELLNTKKVGSIWENRFIIENRIKIAKDLLKDTGNTVVAINDYELYTLGLFLGIYS